MKLGMLQTAEGPKFVGLTLDDQFVDLCAVDDQLPATLHATLAHPDGLMAVAGALSQGMRKGPFVTGELLAPIARPGKILCIGLNYRDHAIETNSPIPELPIVFGKYSQCVVGPEDAIVLPKIASRVDYEAELVVVIGTAGKNIPKEHAFRHVVGYTIGNDVSARDWQKGRPGSQWLLGKSPDTFAPLGPWLVTADEIGDPHDLRVQLRLNGTTMQDSRTTELIFGIDHLVSHLSQFFVLEPGDVIFTGTPPGVGDARKPPVYLKDGDVVEIEIEHLGILKNPVRAE